METLIVTGAAIIIGGFAFWLIYAFWCEDRDNRSIYREIEARNRYEQAMASRRMHR